MLRTMDGPHGGMPHGATLVAALLAFVALATTALRGTADGVEQHEGQASAPSHRRLQVTCFTEIRSISRSSATISRAPS